MLMNLYSTLTWHVVQFFGVTIIVVTIADREDVDVIKDHHSAEAPQYRTRVLVL